MGTLSGVRRHARQLHEHPAAIVDALAHADDAARAHGDARLADARSVESRSSYVRVEMIDEYAAREVSRLWLYASSPASLSAPPATR
jgi:hypothetical protein